MLEYVETVGKRVAVVAAAGESRSLLRGQDGSCFQRCLGLCLAEVAEDRCISIR